MPGPPPPYEQGFRDGLLTARALTVILAGEPGVGTFGVKLDELIDQRNHDLWNILALAQADLSQHPEAESLRRIFHAPSGVLIDSRGRMLFLRLNGAEYDTGVLALLDENAALRRERLGAEEETGADLSGVPTGGGGT